MTTTVSCPRTSNSRGRPLGPTAVAIRNAVGDLTAEFDQMTVRQIFYRLEMSGIVEKTEPGYRQVQKQVLEMRRRGLLEWGFIADGTRWQRKPDSAQDADAYIDQIARMYRRDLWQSQNLRVEIWLEKDGLASIISTVTYNWDVSLMVSRGQSSATFLYSAAMDAARAWKRQGLRTVIYTMYDLDAGGERAARTIANQLPDLAPGVPITVQRLAVTPNQVTAWELPTRPAKKSDPEATKFEAEFGTYAVELDAIDPTRLQMLVEDVIVEHIDTDAWGREQTIEAEERAGLLRLVA